MSCKTIFEKRGKYCFYNSDSRLKKFKTLEEAIEAGGVEKKVSVSGVPYKVPASSVASAVDDAADVVSGYKNGET